jgi:hypothetical protein
MRSPLYSQMTIKLGDRTLKSIFRSVGVDQVMSQTAIAEVVNTIDQAEKRFGLSRNISQDFFQEWHIDLPEITTNDRDSLKVLWNRYIYHRSNGQLLESTAMLLLVSPLLTMAGFYDSPFLIKAEESVRITVSDSEEILQGRIDVLVLLEYLWVIVLESKKTMLSVWSALPQALAYTMANPNLEKAVYVVLTNGDELIFVKVENKKYAFSRVFSPLVSNIDLENILQILRKLGTLAIKS